MGCEKFRDGGLGVGGVRASMERRWLINAKTTVMRQKKWHEVRMQKEQEEVKKFAEILQRRKRERARLAAYIHMQSPKCTANASKGTRIENKRSDWNTCLIEDQDIITRFRQKSALAHNSYFQKASPAADNLWQRNEKVQPYGAYTNSYMKGYHAPDQNFAMGSRLLEDTAYESFNDPENYHTDSDQMSGISEAKAELGRQITLAPEAPTHAFLAEETRRQPLAETKRLSANPRDVEDNSPIATQSENAVHGSPTKNNHLDTSKLGESYAEAYSANPNSTANGHDETTSVDPTCDLREEILKARQANEAATARLIAEVNAIESRLEDCNLTLKPLDFREADQAASIEELNRYTSDTDPLSCDSLGETDSNFSSDSDELASEFFSEKTANSYDDSHGKRQQKQMIKETGVVATSDQQPPYDTDWNTVSVGSPETCHEMNMATAETKSKDHATTDEDQISLRTVRKRAAVASPSPRPSKGIDWNIDPAGFTESCTKMESLGFQAAISEAYAHHKAVSDVYSATVREDKLETKASTKKDSSLVWDIDWDTPPEGWAQKKMDFSQSKPQVSLSRMPRRGEWKAPTKRNSIEQQLTEGSGSLREEIQRFDSCCRRPPTIPGGGKVCRTKEDMPPLPLHHLNFGFSQPMYRGYIQTHSLRPSNPHEQNTMQNSPREPMRRNDSTGEKENYRKIQNGALTEEEEKIFASLERLDWKLAALQSRSGSSGRDSFASQGEFSTKSAPAVMGPRIKKLGLSGWHCAKKPLPYSTVPPRPLTPQSHRPPTGLRRRRQVGLTNKSAGKDPHCCPKLPAVTSKESATHSDAGSERWRSSGTIVYHQRSRGLFDAATAC